MKRFPTNVSWGANAAKRIFKSIQMSLQHEQLDNSLSTTEYSASLQKKLPANTPISCFSECKPATIFVNYACQITASALLSVPSTQSDRNSFICWLKKSPLWRCIHATNSLLSTFYQNSLMLRLPMSMSKTGKDAATFSAVKVWWSVF